MGIENSLIEHEEIERIANFVRNMDIMSGVETDEFEHLKTAVLEGAKAQINKLIKTGERAGYASRAKEGIKVAAKDRQLWFLSDIADRLYDQMEKKDGYLVFIEKP